MATIRTAGSFFFSHSCKQETASINSSVHVENSLFNCQRISVNFNRHICRKQLQLSYVLVYPSSKWHSCELLSEFSADLFVMCWCLYANCMLAVAEIWQKSSTAWCVTVYLCLCIFIHYSVGLKEVNIQQIGLDEKIAIKYELFTDR